MGFLESADPQAPSTGSDSLARVSAATVVAIFALTVSFFTLLWSVVQFRRTQREARRPVLVFVYTDGLWTLVNCGAGSTWSYCGTRDGGIRR